MLAESVLRALAELNAVMSKRREKPRDGTPSGGKTPTRKTSVSSKAKAEVCILCC